MDEMMRSINQSTVMTTTPFSEANRDIRLEADGSFCTKILPVCRVVMPPSITVAPAALQIVLQLLTKLALPSTPRVHSCIRYFPDWEGSLEDRPGILTKYPVGGRNVPDCSQAVSHSMLTMGTPKIRARNVLVVRQ